MTSPNELAFFTVVGHWFDIEAPDPAGATNTPQMLSIYGFVTFTPRLPPGTSILVPNLDLTNTDATETPAANTALELAPIQARILAGELQTIDRANTPNVQLLANTPILGLTKLIYDVSFTKVTYAGANQKLLNFAFTAPTTATTLDLCDPATDLLPYDPTNYT